MRTVPGLRRPRPTLLLATRNRASRSRAWWSTAGMGSSDPRAPAVRVPKRHPAQHRFWNHTTVLEGGSNRGSLEETDDVYSIRNRSLDRQHWTAGTLLGRWNLLPEQFKK